MSGLDFLGGKGEEIWDGFSTFLPFPELVMI